MKISGDITQDTVTSLFNNYKKDEPLIINTYGGDLWAGWAMYDYLNTQELGVVNVIGVCASSGTLPLLAFDERLGSENSKYIIHNPWAMSVGDSEELGKVSDSLSKSEVELINLYESKLNITRDEITSLMKNEKELTADEALNINLITGILKNEKQMVKEKDLEERLEKMESSIISKIKNLFTKPQIKNIVIQTQDGTELDFGDSVETEEQIIVGVTATADGKPADGEYTRPNGDVLVFTGGELTEIKTAETDEESTEAEYLQRIKDLETELAVAKNYSNQLTEKFETVIKSSETMSKRIGELQNKIEKISTSHNPGYNTPPSEKKEVKNRVGNKRK